MDKNDTNQSFSEAKNTIFRFLKIRPRSEKEIFDKLTKKNFDAEVIKNSLRYFKNIDLIDDRKFTKGWISSRLRKPFGINKIIFELKNKGISQEIINEEIDFVKNEFNEFEVVRALAKKKSAKYTGINKIKIKQRVYGYLIRRGFSINSVIKAIKEL